MANFESGSYAGLRYYTVLNSSLIEKVDQIKNQTINKGKRRLLFRKILSHQSQAGRVSRLYSTLTYSILSLSMVATLSYIAVAARTS